MKSVRLGKHISVDVTNVAKDGIWVLIDDHEHFLPYQQFPGFLQATIGQLLNVKLAGPNRLDWPELGVDVSTESLDPPTHVPVYNGISHGKAKARSRRRTRGR